MRQQRPPARSRGSPNTDAVWAISWSNGVSKGAMCQVAWFLLRQSQKRSFARSALSFHQCVTGFAQLFPNHHPTIGDTTAPLSWKNLPTPLANSRSMKPNHVQGACQTYSSLRVARCNTRRGAERRDRKTAAAMLDCRFSVETRRRCSRDESPSDRSRNRRKWRATP